MIVLMVVVTTLITPPLLRWLYREKTKVETAALYQNGME
jgi:hypothetical protein